MIEGESHLKLATRTGTPVLMLPVAHAFSRCGSHVPVLTKTFGELWPLGWCKCRTDNGGREKQAQHDAKRDHSWFRCHGFRGFVVVVVVGIVRSTATL